MTQRCSDVALIGSQEQLGHGYAAELTRNLERHRVNVVPVYKGAHAPMHVPSVWIMLVPFGGGRMVKERWIWELQDARRCVATSQHPPWLSPASVHMLCVCHYSHDRMAGMVDTDILGEIATAAGIPDTPIDVGRIDTGDDHSLDWWSEATRASLKSLFRALGITVVVGRTAAVQPLETIAA
ncbi:unnamed protein product [Vitrella brassicaformis CCMP3155]|uniref:Uncharacterized protein n=1 Tax=Vitrella brassicaformis (strain CCMP3155) TaxID=1169540 RepID=A0A0G4EMX5_VITBC|nr:unnamed protein product [Vitrella brassicaformis CCMP3155]|eukprot:CEL98335.1 unnamed protein product [Vitrella brassicaformis CCMP3155]